MKKARRGVLRGLLASCLNLVENPPHQIPRLGELHGLSASIAIREKKRREHTHEFGAEGHHFTN